MGRTDATTGKRRSGTRAASGTAIEPAATGQSTLTPRQRQILALLREGRANKEIAAALGIGLGTVKQHINALFKKLDVSNRTMAVTRGHAEGAAQRAPARGAAPAPSATGDAHPPAIAPALAGNERRPATVLSLSLTAATSADAGEPKDGPVAPEEDAGSAAHRLLARIAAEFGAVLVPRTDGGDMVFGVQRCREQHVLRAVRAAHALVRGLGGPRAAPAVRAGVASGTVAVGTSGAGDWDGQILDGNLLRTGRAMAARGAGGTMIVGATARALTERLCGTDGGIPERIDLGHDPVFAYHVPPPPVALRGRNAEAAVLARYVADVRRGRGGAVAIEGEAGRGKTALLHPLHSLCANADVRLGIWRCLPPDGQPVAIARGCLMDTARGAIVDAATLGDRLRRGDMELPSVLALDDLHWLPFRAVQELFDGIGTAVANGRFVVTTARPVVRASVSPLPGAEALPLDRLPDGNIDQLCKDVAEAPLDAGTRARIRDLARGNPLFAVELTRARSADGSLPAAPPVRLLTLLMARVDALRPDHRLLRLVSGAQTPPSVAALRGAWPNDADAVSFDAALDHAEAAGLLRRDTGDTVTLAHPMLQVTLAHVFHTHSSDPE
jgi:DNA-binding CsgD family transcriptional regulator